MEDAVSTPLCVYDNINALHVGDKVLGGGCAVMVSIAQPFLANPDLVANSRLGGGEYRQLLYWVQPDVS